MISPIARLPYQIGSYEQAPKPLEQAQTALAPVLSPGVSVCFFSSPLAAAPNIVALRPNYVAIYLEGKNDQLEQVQDERYKYNKREVASQLLKRDNVKRAS